MKPSRAFLIACLALPALSAVAATSQPETYSVVGYFKGKKPTESAITKAALAVAEKVPGMTQVGDPREADHQVEVLFVGGTFEVYVDALPLTRTNVGAPPLRSATLPWDYSMEKADSERSQPR